MPVASGPQLLVLAPSPWLLLLVLQPLAAGHDAATSDFSTSAPTPPSSLLLENDDDDECQAAAPRDASAVDGKEGSSSSGSCALSALQTKKRKTLAQVEERARQTSEVAGQWLPSSWHTPSSQSAMCEIETGGTCRFTSCNSNRNAECVHRRCTCRPNLCAKDGKCQIPSSLFKVDVVKVSGGKPYFPKPHNKIDTAVCLSGGGARAAALTIGVLRALENLKLMKTVDALSSISGSLFASALYMFANPSMYKAGSSKGQWVGHPEPLWGRASDPKELSLSVLDYDTSPLGTTFADGWGGSWGTAKDALEHVIPNLVKDRKDYDIVWRRLMRKQFLKPFGLTDKDALLALDEAHVARIKAANPQLANFTFLTPQPGKPKVFVMGAAILAVDGKRKTDAASFQISPDYIGTPFYVDTDHRPLYTAADGKVGELSAGIVGGGLIETFAFGGDAPADQDGGFDRLPSPSRPFTLADAMAIATYADFLPGESTVGWTPSHKYWPIGPGNQKAQRYMIGDGGFIEDTGLLPMLQRRAKRIALFLFVGPGQQLNDAVDFCDLSTRISKGSFDPKSFEPKGKLADSIYVLFGYGYDDGKWHKMHNTVFKQNEMFHVACGLQRLKKQGKPLVFKAKHAVQPNPYWGIQGGYTVEIAYVYNDKIPEFEELLPLDTQKSLTKDMKGFPTDLPAGLYMKPRIIKLMAAQAEYAVLQNAKVLTKVLGSRPWWQR
mmetsp:Transcript_108757/g.272559  ORF Transcript_108757/g.272559 Transcript_108757/m.272559 type:complete len:721 (-) Transcript_108757:203-2365(-)